MSALALGAMEADSPHTHQPAASWFSSLGQGGTAVTIEEQVATPAVVAVHAPTLTAASLAHPPGTGPSSSSSYAANRLDLTAIPTHAWYLSEKPDLNLLRRTTGLSAAEAEKLHLFEKRRGSRSSWTETGNVNHKSSKAAKKHARDGSKKRALSAGIKGVFRRNNNEEPASAARPTRASSASAASAAEAAANPDAISIRVPTADTSEARPPSEGEGTGETSQSTNSRPKQQQSAEGEDLERETQLLQLDPELALEWLVIDVSDSGPGLGGKSGKALFAPFE